ncbi:Phosphatidylinositol 4-kinase pik1alpha (PI4-kinase)(PtdIns-4-kinase) [Elasticomyces elasticus]|nr:Phosphatidylinositol 4-kinase pik1alpha (PI4-kinase)(PtdIns-4-kinase) [Elasticomyces elasticus]
MSWNLLARFIESEHFNNDPSLAVAYLARYADHVGIQYVLSSKLRQFSYEEIEFFLPQLCHLLVSANNESMALEEFIMDLCEESVNAALLTFWLYQTYLFDLSTDPTSNAFRTCRRIYNKVQRIVFGAHESAKRDKIRENILPVTVLSSLILASVAAPFLPVHAGPLAVAQARKPRPVEETIADNVQVQKLGRSRTVAGGSRRTRNPRSSQARSDSEERQLSMPSDHRPQPLSSPPTRSNAIVEPSAGRRSVAIKPQTMPNVKKSQSMASSSSLPDLWAASDFIGTTPPPSERRPDGGMQRAHSHISRGVTPSTLSRSHKIRMLRSNYFRSQTQFLTALEGISTRLVHVPKPARLSALRAELALIAQDLPAEVDVPVICPATLEDGAPGRSRHHRIVRLNPAEATSLNSAEKVPYLLMVEVLREDFDFDPDSESNLLLLNELLAERGKVKRRLFDITDASRESVTASPSEQKIDSVLEPANGDLASSALLQDLDGESQLTQPSPRSKTPVNGSVVKELPRLSSGVGIVSTSGAVVTPRASDVLNSRSSSPGARKVPLHTHSRAQVPDQPDFSALATHMRTASQMLAQLEMSGAKRPKAEVAMIKAKIIASMQSLEEQSFYTHDASHTPNFDTVMANANIAASSADPEDLEDNLEAATDPDLSSGAGAARMENDQKTGGVQRKGDRDDPSAATFGEEWTAKKERIRRTSPYGWMENWDVVSVIVKTNDDLRQEAFACQLIATCSRVWTDTNVDVWVKCMRILVTGERSGLIETITNGVSLHSIKRSLTLASIAAGINPRKRIATLKDHFAQAFGAPDTEAYAAAIENFTKSLAAYSVISYVLQLKDRHNGNILIDNLGHIVHIDFGFMLSNSPGSMGFEAAPFKLTAEYVELLGGTASEAFARFKQLFKAAFQALRREAERIVMLVEIMGRESKMPCFGGGVTNVVTALRSRFVLQMSKEEAEGWVEDLVAKSLGSYYTRL